MGKQKQEPKTRKSLRLRTPARSKTVKSPNKSPKRMSLSVDDVLDDVFEDDDAEEKLDILKV